MGMRFKTVSEMLMATTYMNIPIMSGKSWSRIKSPKRSASARFDAGPAAATIASPHKGARRRLYGLYGDRLCPSEKETPGESAVKMGRIIEPKRSRCGMGLSVRRPCNRAVGSPKPVGRDAVHHLMDDDGHHDDDNEEGDAEYIHRRTISSLLLFF